MAIGRLTPPQKARKFRFSVNRQGRNKQWDYKLLTTKFEDREGTIDDLIEAVRAGYAVNGAWFGGLSRSKANVLGVGCLLLDFDNSKAKLDSNGLPLKDSQGKIISEYDPQLTLEAALTHPFLSRYAAAIYTSPSHKPTWHKLRAVIPLPRFLPADDYESVAQLVLEEFPMADPACSDAGRVFFGNTNTEVYFLGGEPLPPEWIARAKNQAAQRQAEQERIRQERLKWLETQNTDSTKELALEALKYIPPRQPGTGTYNESLTVLMALVDLFGSASAESIAETWSPSDRKAGWIIPQKIRSFKRNGVTVGSLFHIAQQYGWKLSERPSRASDKHNPVEPDPQAYAEYVAREKEEERIAEAIEKESFLDWLKRKILKLPPQYKKGFAQYQPVRVYLPKKLIWSGKSPLPTPQDYAGCHLKIIFPKGKRTQCLANGSLRFTNGLLKVTIKDSRHADVINKLASVTFLDATAQKEVEAAKLGIDPTTIVEIEEERPPIDNLTIFNINLPGMKSGNYSASCQQKQQKLLQTILSAQGYESDSPEELSSEKLESLGITAFKVLASKKDKHLPKDGYWHHHSRATNEFKGVEILVVFGTPNPNVGAVQDEYRALFGSLEGFEAYYQHLVRSEIIQLVGRQRPHLYREQQFYIYMIGTDQDLSFLTERYGIKVIERQSFEFCPEAGTPKQASRWKILLVAQQLKAAGQKVTAKAIAAATGLSERWVRELASNYEGGFAQFKKAELFLDKSSIGGVPVFESDQKPNEIHQAVLARQELRDWMGLNPVEVAASALQIIHDHGWGEFREFLRSKGAEIQALYLGSIAPLFLPEIWIEEVIYDDN